MWRTFFLAQTSNYTRYFTLNFWKFFKKLFLLFIWIVFAAFPRVYAKLRRVFSALKWPNSVIIAIQQRNTNITYFIIFYYLYFISFQTFTGGSAAELCRGQCLLCRLRAQFYSVYYPVVIKTTHIRESWEIVTVLMLLATIAKVGQVD